MAHELLSAPDGGAIPANTEREEQSGAFTDSRKAELFDILMESTHDSDPCGDWYGMLHGIGMDEDEMCEAGLDLPELKVTEEAAESMAEYIVSGIMKTKMEGHQIYIEFSVSELAARFGLDTESCTLAEDMFFEELYSHEEIDTAEILNGKLYVKPENSIIGRLHEMEPPGIQMGGASL